MTRRNVPVLLCMGVLLCVAAVRCSADSVFDIVVDHTASPDSPETTLRSLAYDSADAWLYAGFIHGQSTRYVERYSLSFADRVPAADPPVTAAFNFGQSGFGLQPTALAYYSGNVYVGATTDPADFGAATSPSGLYVMPGSLSAATLAPAPLSPAVLSTIALEALAVDSSTAKLYAAYGNQIYRYDLSATLDNPTASAANPLLDPTWTPLTLTDSDSRVRGMCVFGGSLYAVDRLSNSLFRVALGGESVTSKTLDEPGDVTVVSDGLTSTLVVSHFAADPVAAYYVSLDLSTVTSIMDPVYGTTDPESNRYQWFDSSGGYSGIEADPNHLGAYFMAADNMAATGGVGDAQGRDRVYYESGATPELDPACLSLASVGLGLILHRRRRRGRAHRAR